MFENDATIQPCQLFYCLLINFMVQTARDESVLLEHLDQQQEEQGNLIVKPALMKILCFLSDNVDLKSMTTLHSLDHFRHVVSSASQCYISNDKVVNAICDVCIAIQTIDHVIDFMDKLKSIFEVDSSATSNNLYGPNKIAVNSALGLFVRKVSSYWECMPFEAQCGAMKDYLQFCIQPYHHGVSPIHSKGCTSSFSYDFVNWSDETTLDSNYDAKEFMETTEDFLLDNNIASSERNVHDYFDKLSQNPLAIKYRGQETKSLEILLQELRLIELGQNSLNPKHQFAMMTLALTWIGAGNFSMAQSAVEEALKTSHQRGDHPSVVKCLLLLFYIMEKSEGFESARGEELLRRCIAKSGALGLSDLISEAVLSFIRLKSSAVNISSSTKQYLEPTLDWGFESLWNLLSFSLHGEPSLTVKYCLTKDIGSIDDVAAATGPGVIQQPGKVVSEAFVSIDQRYAECSVRSFTLYAELWSRIGQYDIAVLYCNRAINMFGNDTKPQYLMALMAKLIFNEMNRLSFTCPDALISAITTLYRSYQNLLNHVQAQNQMFNKVTGGSHMILNYLSIFLCVCGEDVHRANRFAQTLSNSIGSISSSISSSFLSTEDQVRCLLVGVVITEKIKGVTLNTTEANIMELGNKYQCSHICREPSIRWLLNYSSC